MRRPVHGACAAIIGLAVVADAGALRAQGEVPVQEFTVTKTQLETHAQHGRPREEIQAALGRPLLRECRDDFEVWTYRVENRRVQLLFQDGVLSLTIFGNVTLEGEPHPC